MYNHGLIALNPCPQLQTSHESSITRLLERIAPHLTSLSEIRIEIEKEKSHLVRSKKRCLVLFCRMQSYEATDLFVHALSLQVITTQWTCVFGDRNMIEHRYWKKNKTVSMYFYLAAAFRFDVWAVNMVSNVLILNKQPTTKLWIPLLVNIIK